MGEVGPLLHFIHRARPWQVGAALRKVMRYGPAEREVAGFRLWLDPSSNFGYRMLTDGFIEPQMTKPLLALLRPGDTFVDLGGNEGWFSLLAGRAVGRSGRALCVEPQERLWPVITRNFALNDLPQCTLVPFAVGKSGRAQITLAPGVNTGASSMAYKPKPLLHRTQEVMMRSLDEIAELHGVERIDVLKIDIEGFEYNALDSARRLLREKRIRNILMEFHEPQLAALGQSSKMIFDLLRENGMEHVGEEGGVHHFGLRA